METEKDLQKHKEKQKRKQLKYQADELDFKIKALKAAELEAKNKKSLQKLKIEENNTNGLFGSVSEPRKSLNSYLRNQNKLEVSIISILDRKAAILIRICTTLITGLIVFNSYVEENVESGHMISHILVVGLLLTLVSSILATKPAGGMLRWIFRTQVSKEHGALEDNIFFMVKKHSLEDYEKAMSEVVKSQNLQIGNQVRANYILALNNGMKSRLLDFSYSLFLGTFVIVGLVFLAGKLLH